MPRFTLLPADAFDLARYDWASNEQHLIDASVQQQGGVALVHCGCDGIVVPRSYRHKPSFAAARAALAADGLQGLERLREERPAVVLSDIEMPRMDGFDFVRNIRADASLKDLPVIMITSRIAEKHRDHAEELGVNHYLGKPYSEDDLLHLIKEYALVTTPAEGA